MKRTILSSIFALSLLPVTSFASGLTAEQAVNELKLQELAQTYSEKKIITATQSDKASRFDALLVDIGAISVADLSNSKVKSEKLGAFIKDQLDLSENYIGNLSDKNIVERIQKTWLTSEGVQDKAVINTLNSFIDQDFTTGYNLVDVKQMSNFNPELMIRYGHSDLTHAIQLVYLIKSEGFNPKVQFTPKSSAFVYLPEWGEPSYPVYTLESGKMVAVVKEYNLDFEFQTTEAKKDFMNLINQYAKKDSADEKGLIVESWWQPFYRSYTPMENYKVLIENQIKIGQYQADLMSLPEKAKSQAKKVQAAAKSYDVKSHKVWVNPSFYRYMQGDYK
ncbi:hypothetical protein MACH09_46450 [Vibrio sp. MACH09]|uniref:hypothetical protein n=1 Tax=Vibrio sp. MACH09 TaxID=3025122 RepID=UPI002792A7CF|nr:hypothetical protein [Vibrio sp. MACH09]GLO64137.1 hypothetical protein MACH09_46450 [Vibrio sp. MACH09]